MGHRRRPRLALPLILGALLAAGPESGRCFQGRPPPPRRSVVRLHSERSGPGAGKGGSAGGGIQPESLEELKRSADIVEVVKNFIELRETPSGGIGRCPFHDDRSPSLSVSKDRGLYRCFACGAGGDAIKFVREYTGAGFVDAVETVAELSNFPLQRTGRRRAGSARRVVAGPGQNATATAATAAAPPPEAEEDPEVSRERLLLCLEAAAAYYQRVLATAPCAGGARAHLRERRIPPAVARDFRLGFSPRAHTPGSPTVVQQLSELGFSLRTMEAAGIVSERAAKRAAEGDRRWLPQDRYSGRLIVPIRDATSRVVGFGARILPADEEEEEEAAAAAEAGGGPDSNAESAGAKAFKPPKYLNSPETAVFRKGETLFGLCDAADSSRHGDFGVILVEGYFDVLALHGAGVQSCAAALGTGITASQVRQASRLSGRRRVTLLLDGDAAGVKAARRVCAQILPALADEGVEAFVSFLPNGRDPADWLEQGAVASDFTEHLAADAQPFQEWFVASLLEDFAADRGKDAAGALRRLLGALSDWIAQLSSPADRTFAAFQAAERAAAGNDALRVALEADIAQMVSEKRRRRDAIAASKAPSTAWDDVPLHFSPSAPPPTEGDDPPPRPRAPPAAPAPPPGALGPSRAEREATIWSRAPAETTADGVGALDASALSAAISLGNDLSQLRSLEEAERELRRSRGQRAGAPLGGDARRYDPETRRIAREAQMRVDVLDAATRNAAAEGGGAAPSGEQMAALVGAGVADLVEQPRALMHAAEQELLAALLHAGALRPVSLETLRLHLSECASFDAQRKWLLDALYALPDGLREASAAEILPACLAAAPRLFEAAAVEAALRDPGALRAAPEQARDAILADLRLALRAQGEPPANGQAAGNASAAGGALGLTGGTVDGGLPEPPANATGDLTPLFFPRRDLLDAGFLEDPQLLIQQALAASLRARALQRLQVLRDAFRAASLELEALLLPGSADGTADGSADGTADGTGPGGAGDSDGDGDGDGNSPGGREDAALASPSFDEQVRELQYPDRSAIAEIREEQEFAGVSARHGASEVAATTIRRRQLGALKAIGDKALSEDARDALEELFYEIREDISGERMPRGVLERAQSRSALTDGDPPAAPAGPQAPAAPGAAPLQGASAERVAELKRELQDIAGAIHRQSGVVRDLQERWTLIRARAEEMRGAGRFKVAEEDLRGVEDRLDANAAVAERRSKDAMRRVDEEMERSAADAAARAAEAAAPAAREAPPPAEALRAPAPLERSEEPFPVFGDDDEYPMAEEFEQSLEAEAAPAAAAPRGPATMPQATRREYADLGAPTEPPPPPVSSEHPGFQQLKGAMAAAAPTPAASAEPGAGAGAGAAAADAGAGAASAIRQRLAAQWQQAKDRLQQDRRDARPQASEPGAPEAQKAPGVQEVPTAPEAPTVPAVPAAPPAVEAAPRSGGGGGGGVIGDKVRRVPADAAKGGFAPASARRAAGNAGASPADVLVRRGLHRQVHPRGGDEGP